MWVRNLGISILDDPQCKFPKMEFLYPLSIAFLSASPSPRPHPRHVLIQTHSSIDMTDLIINHRIRGQMATIASDIETVYWKIWSESEALWSSSYCVISLYMPVDTVSCCFMPGERFEESSTLLSSVWHLLLIDHPWYWLRRAPAKLITCPDLANFFRTVILLWDANFLLVNARGCSDLY